MKNKELKKYHENLRSLIDEIIDLVPEAIDQRDIIYALIKTHIHKEKHFIWNYMKHWLNKDSVNWFFEAVINPKIETHKIESWGNFDKNLEWVREYQAIPNSSKFIQGGK